MPGVGRFQLKIIEISDQKVESLFSHNPTSTLVPNSSVWEVDVRVADSTLQWRLESVCSSATTVPWNRAKLIRRIYLRAMVHRLFFGRSSVRMPGQLVKLSGIKRLTSWQILPKHMFAFFCSNHPGLILHEVWFWSRCALWIVISNLVHSQLIGVLEFGHPTWIIWL